MALTDIRHDGMLLVDGQTAKTYQQHLSDLDFERDIGRSASGWGWELKTVSEAERSDAA